MQTFPSLEERADFVARYLHGQCDVLAIVLSISLEKPIMAFHPVHRRRDGTDRIDPDYVHVAVIDDDGLIDAKGKRTRDEIIADFSSLIELIKRSEDLSVGIAERIFHSAEEFLECGSNPENALEAYEALILQPQFSSLAEAGDNHHCLVRRDIGLILDSRDDDAPCLLF